jgi:hypothetical protein
LANDTPHRPDPHGYGLTRSVTRCILCGERPYSYPGKRCGPCFREANGGALVALAPLVIDLPAVVVAPVVIAPAPKPPKPAPVVKVRVPCPPKMCRWPGCDRPHSSHGACRRDSRRLADMGAIGTDPATWEERWSDYRAELAGLAAWNGAVHRGLGKFERRPTITLEQYRAMVRR